MYPLLAVPEPALEPKPPLGPFEALDRGAGCEARLAMRPDRRLGVGSAAGVSAAAFEGPLAVGAFSVEQNGVSDPTIVSSALLGIAVCVGPFPCDLVQIALWSEYRID